MAYVLFSTLNSHVTPYLNDCPDPIVAQALRVAARQFCVDTEPWLVWLAAFDTVADEPDYALTLPAGAEASIRRIKQVKIDDVIQREETYLLKDGATLEFQKYYIPSVAGKDVEVRLSLVTTLAAVQLPDFLVDKWGMVIADKALADLYSMPKPWRDPEAARIRAENYRNGCFEAKREMIDLSRTTVPNTPPTFGWA